MKFVKETAIYAPSGTLKRFQGLETSFQIEQGKISALISESELIELRNGNKTMYSRLYSAEQTVSGLNKLYTDVSSKYDAVRGQYTDLDTKVGKYKESVDGFSGELTKLSERIRDDYSTTETMQTYVRTTIQGLETKVSETYVTTGIYTEGIEGAKSYADDAAAGALQSAQSDATSKANAALSAAKTDTDDKLKSYSTTVQMNSAIEQKAQAIELSVSNTYATKDAINGFITESRAKSLIQSGNNYIRLWVEESSYQDYCNNGDFSNGLQYWTVISSGASLGTDGTQKYALIRSSYSIFQEISSKEPQKISITFEASTGVAGSKITVLRYNTELASYDLTTDWVTYSVTDVDISQNRTIRFRAENGPAQIRNIRFLESAKDYASAKIETLSDEISLKVSKDGIASAINQTAQSVLIQASKINFNGLVTANNYFQILTDGSFKATYGILGGWTIRNGAMKSNDQKITLDPANNRIYFDTGDGDYVTELSPDGTRTNYLTVDGGIFGNPALLIDAGASSYIQFYDSFSDDGDDIITLNGNLKVYGTKSRVARTENFSDRLLYCYETPTPMFGDLGCGTTNDRGIAIVDIDPAFSETINSGIEYQVFLQKEGEGDIWVAEKEESYFTVRGTPNLKFSWEVKCIQKHYEHLRLDEKEVQEAAQKDARETQKDYDIIIDTVVEDYDKEMEELINESN